MDVWLERLKRFLEIIRPKTYNIIARSLAGQDRERFLTTWANK